MGREVACRVDFAQQSSEGRAQLESDHVLFRGEFRLRIDFKDLSDVVVSSGVLKLAAPEGAALVHLGSPEAERWAEAIRHPKKLIDKLGVKPGMRISLLGVRDARLEADLAVVGADVSRRRRKNSDLIFIAIDDHEDLPKLDGLEASMNSNGAIWTISPRGRKDFNENHIYAAARALDLKDVKTARFSDTHTANRFVIPKARR